LGDLWHSAHFIVDECSTIVLQGLLELLDDNVGLAIFDGSLQCNVGLDNVDKLEG
jgi:hypothetical protein